MTEHDVIVHSVSRDEGFTVVEVVVAAAILFFALTAILGLVFTTTQMTVSSRAKSVLVNEMATELEKYRALPYDDVDMFPAGKIPETSTRVVSGITIQLKASIVVDPAGHPGTKEVTLVGSAKQPGYKDVRSTIVAVIGDGITGVAQGDGPTIEFVSPTPESGSVVFGNELIAESKDVAGGSLPNGSLAAITVKATSLDANVVSIDFYVGQYLLRDDNSAFAESAHHLVEPPAPTIEWGFNWDSTQIDDAGNPCVEDGNRTITVVVTDDLNRKTVTSIVLVVDNKAPLAPTGLNLLWTGSVSGQSVVQGLDATWVAGRDGTDAAPTHWVEVFENTNGAASLGSWVSTYATGTPGAVDDVSGFACYGMRAQAFGPRGGVSLSPVVEFGPVFTRPEASGAYDVTKSGTSVSYTSRPSLTKPRFPYDAGALSVKLQRYTNSGTALSSEIDVTAAVKTAWDAGLQYTHAGDTWSQSGLGASSIVSPDKYRYQVSITPVGWNSAPQVLYSNWIGPPSKRMFQVFTNTNQAMIPTW